MGYGCLLSSPLPVFVLGVLVKICLWCQQLVLIYIKKPRSFVALLDKMANNDHIKLDNTDKVYVSLYDRPFSRYKYVENRKCTELTQNDSKHLIDKSYSIHSWILSPPTTPSPKFHCFALLYPFSRYKIIKTRKCSEWPQNDLSHLTVKSIHWTLTPEAQISIRFALRSLIFQIIEVFGFPIEYNGERQKILKNQKLKMLNIQNSTFQRRVEKKSMRSFKIFYCDVREE